MLDLSSVTFQIGRKLQLSKQIQLHAKRKLPEKLRSLQGHHLIRKQNERLLRIVLNCFQKTLQQPQLFVSTSAPREKYRTIKTSLEGQKQRPRLPNPAERH